MELAKAVFGVFRTQEAAEKARDRLKAAGFDKSDVFILLPENEGDLDFASTLGNRVRSTALLGLSGGAIVGVLLGGLMNIGAVPIFGDGPIADINPYVLTLIAALIGAILGGASGVLIGVGIPERAGTRYESYLQQGGILLSVRVNDSQLALKASQTLEETGADDIALLGESAGWKAATTPHRAPGRHSLTNLLHD